MEEYITKEQAIESFEEWTNSREDYIEHPVSFARNICSIKSADVVERKTYEQMIQMFKQEHESWSNEFKDKRYYNYKR